MHLNKFRKFFLVWFLGAVCFNLAVFQVIYAQKEETVCFTLRDNIIYVQGQEAFAISRQGNLSYTYLEHIYPSTSKLTIKPAKGVKIKKNKYSIKLPSTISPYGTKVCTLKTGHITIEVYYPQVSAILEMNSDKSREAWIIVEGIGFTDVVTTSFQRDIVKAESLIIVCKINNQTISVAKLVFLVEDPPSCWYDNQTQTIMEEIKTMVENK